MAKLILVGLSEQAGVTDLAARIAELDPAAMVIVTTELHFDAIGPILALFQDLSDGDPAE